MIIITMALNTTKYTVRLTTNRKHIKRSNNANKNRTRNPNETNYNKIKNIKR